MPDINFSAFDPFRSTDHKFNNLTGHRVGRLLVLSVFNKYRRKTNWLCLCDCGTFTVVLAERIKHSLTKSCGCLRFAYRSTNSPTYRHGQSEQPEYDAYSHAKSRCNNPKDQRYKSYGGRGIEFRFASFEEFFSELGKRPSDTHSLNRIDNDGHYEPGNVEWATDIEQNRNRTQTRVGTLGGVTRPIREWAAMYGVSPDLVNDRVFNKHWDLYTALTTPRYMRR